MGHWKAAIDMKTVGELKSYLCVDAKPYGGTVNSYACAQCESQCAYGRRLLELLEVETVTGKSKLESIQQYLGMGMSEEDAAHKAGYKSVHALRVAQGISKRKSKGKAGTINQDFENAFEPDAPAAGSSIAEVRAQGRPPQDAPIEHTFEYKCRLCDSVFRAGLTCNEKLVLGMITHLAASGNNYPQPFAPALYTIHLCTDGNIGFAEFIGAKQLHSPK